MEFALSTLAGKRYDLSIMFKLDKPCSSEPNLDNSNTQFGQSYVIAMGGSLPHFIPFDYMQSHNKK